MIFKHISVVAVAGLAAVVSMQSAYAESKQNIQFGIGYASYNNDSSELTGAATPPGVTAEAVDGGTAAIVYERYLTNNWTVQLAGGVPPEVDLKATGSAAALGVIGSAKAWYPAALAMRKFRVNNQLSLHAGAGLNFTHFSHRKIKDNYTTTFSGTSSSSEIDNSVGPVIKLGASMNLNKSWFMDLSYSRYWITADATVTTATPGAGDIARKISVDVDPDVLSLTVGYRF